MTISWHVDDLKVIHKDSKIIDSFLKWLQMKYGTVTKVKAVQGKIHEYLGMKFYFMVKGQVVIDMINYVKSMVDSFPQEYLDGAKVTSPWTEKLFQVAKNSPKLSPKMAELFQTTTARGLFLCKRARPDISPAIAYLTTRVRNPTQD